MTILVILLSYLLLVMTVVIIESFHATLLPASNFPNATFAPKKKIAGLMNGQLTTMIPTQGLTKALICYGWGGIRGGWAP